MSETEKYTERDLVIATELGKLTGTILSMEKKIDSLLEDKITEHNKIWQQMNLHNEKISHQNGMIKWIIGIGVGLQAVWIAILSFLKGSH